jgi:hypothetical protein
MSILDWNSTKVKNLTGAEIWLFIVARVLIGFGAGILAYRFYPQIAGSLGWPAVLLGFVLFLIAAKGLARTK